jgi:GNAT superfamily N-acetyltransferase
LITSFSIDGPLLGQSAACERILRALPDFFGIESAVQHYIQAVNDLPTVVACVEQQPVGFFTIKQHFPRAAEAYVLGVLPEYQRLGIGRAMLRWAEDYLREQKVDYLQVKTLGPSHADPGYARTRAFYEREGFCPLEEFSQIWDESNPCLILVKWIGTYNEE